MFQFLFLHIAGEDPEARRMRTVKNIADLRQNLEETMSSLRGTQISHRYVWHVLMLWLYIYSRCVETTSQK